MNIVRSLVVITLSVIILVACKSKEKPATPSNFCQPDCGMDTIRVNDENKNKAFVSITMQNCEADSITWGNRKMATYRQLLFAELVGKYVKLNKDYVRIHLFDDHAWLQFNECDKGQGYIVKLPFNKTENISRKNSAFNPMYTNYKVDEGMVAYTDRGNIFVEDMATGKKAMMTFGVQTDMEYDNMPATVESVEITPTHIKAKVLIEKEWKDIEKDITLE
ncbi:MAG TPA: hypothetical protein PLU37_12485 [Chitinophagaceae bacterium]|nr:hypothetical protein [Chitinophagaceae bacterium]HPG12344.1 hypothetical protein [Chitinophagaceae bacterium]